MDKSWTDPVQVPRLLVEPIQRRPERPIWESQSLQTLATQYEKQEPQLLPSLYREQSQTKHCQATIDSANRPPVAAKSIEEAIEAEIPLVVW